MFLFRGAKTASTLKCFFFNFLQCHKRLLTLARGREGHCKPRSITGINRCVLVKRNYIDINRYNMTLYMMYKPENKA